MTSQFVLCSGCSTELAPGLLSCPSCSRLVHAGRLTELASTAALAEQNEDWTGALTAWREAVMLLPLGSRQRQAAEQKIAALSPRVTAGVKPGGLPWWKRASSLGPVGFLVALLGKAKFLLLGFSKLGTLMTFLVSLSVYWAIWGWQFALCFLLSIYVHEMGHVAALNSYGIPATAPMFIPGFGALVRLKQNPASAIEDARVGLAGPIWGLGAALASFAVYALTGNAFWGAVARAGAFINLFNLMPVWQLDGGRGLRSLDRIQVWFLVALTAVLWYFTREGLLILIGLLMVFRAVTKREEPTESDWTGFIQFAGLLTALALLCLIPMPTPITRN
jgi:Zn-dependent protease